MRARAPLHRLGRAMIAVLCLIAASRPLEAPAQPGGQASLVPAGQTRASTGMAEPDGSDTPATDPLSGDGPGGDPGNGPGAGVGQRLCAADLNGNGDAADDGEIAACTAMAAGGWQCPIQRVACVAEPGGGPVCPAGPQFACATPAAGGPPSCSPHACIDTATSPIETEQPVDDPGALPDGPVDPAGNCLGAVEIFGGRALRCRPPGLSVTFSNCCKDKGRIVRDGMGASLTSVSTKVAVAQGVFRGMSAAFAAFQAGASAGAAAGAGANAMMIGVDPTSIAISLAVNFIIEVLLQGCDSQDMETGMLRGSGMCHEVGTYCASSFLGLCLQKAKSHCCFNTKLGRILQEQGRPQLKSFNQVGWGAVKKPNCRGFTPEEFQSLDFSRIDLTDYYAEIETRAQSLIQSDMKERMDAYLNTIGK